MSDKLISLESVLKEIRRFKGYIDDDMIERFSIAFKRLPAVPQEMTAREFFEEYRRMCDHTGRCATCPIMEIANIPRMPCKYLAYRHPEKAVAIVEAWAREHPKERSEE